MAGTLAEKILLRTYKLTQLVLGNKCLYSTCKTTAVNSARTTVAKHALSGIQPKTYALIFRVFVGVDVLEIAVA